MKRLAGTIFPDGIMGRWYSDQSPQDINDQLERFLLVGDVPPPLSIAIKHVDPVQSWPLPWDRRFVIQADELLQKSS